jgi:hypothetical protein
MTLPRPEARMRRFFFWIASRSVDGATPEMR